MSDHILHSDQSPNHSAYSVTTPDGAFMSGGGQRYGAIHLNGAILPCAFIGGIGTEPEHRRGGLVREIVTAMAEEGGRRGIPVTILHPFSFAYYRRFGFERVADHRVLEFPMSALNVFERYADLSRASESDRPALARLYNAFAEGRNLLPVRGDDYPFPVGDAPRTYISCDKSGAPDGYVTLDIEKYFSVNRMVSVNLHVREMAFLSPAALDRLLGFLRMYEGELDTVCIHDCGMMPEVELRLRHYMHTRMTVIPDIMARINDVAAVLEAVRYPNERGSFTVKCAEPEGTPWSAPALAAKTTGVFRVDYENGKGTVTRLHVCADHADCDLSATTPALTQLIFGFESGGAGMARYAHGVVLSNPAEDFFRAFPRRPGGVFEHF